MQRRSSTPDLEHLKDVNIPDSLRETEDEQRVRIAREKFEALVDNINLKEKTYETGNREKAWEMDIHIRNRCAKYLQNCHNSAYYRELHERVANGDELLDHELYYYVVTNKDVKNIPVDILALADAKWRNTPLGTNIHALWVLNEWQRTRGYASTTIQDKLKQDAINTLKKCDNDNSFINLSGFNFGYLNLTEFTFKFCDLTGANFSRSNLSHTTISYCVANQATLTEIDRYPLHVDDRLDITQTSLQHTRIGTITQLNCRLINCDLSSADFSTAEELKADMLLCRLHNANLQSVALTNTNADNGKKGALQGCNLIGTNLTNVWLTAEDIENSRLLHNNACASSEDLRLVLNNIYARVEKFRALHADSKQLNEHIDTIQQIVCDNILLQLMEIDDTRAAHATLNQAINHPLFQPHDQWEQSVNSAYKSMNTLFSTCCRHTDKHAYYATPAMRKLEEMNDILTAELGRKYQNMQ